MDALDLTNKKQRTQAQAGVAEKISSEIIPCLFHDSEENAWACLPVDDHYETWAVNSLKLSRYLERLYWEEWKRCFGQGSRMPAGMLKERLAFLEGKALFDEEAERSVSLRVGASNSRVIYVDLCDSRRRVVRVSPIGWEIEDVSEVVFRRTDDMLSLPIPERGGSVEELQPFLNIDADQFVLAVGWLLAALRSVGPYPLMVLIGPAGSAKSSLARILRTLVDPDKIPLCELPREVRDLTVASQNSHVLAFDNLSKLSPQLSNALCRLATGAGNKERKLYTNKDLARFPFVARPMILNGIRMFVTAPDLLDRSIVLHLQHIDHKRTEAALRRDFNDKKGRIFGALLDLLVEGVRNLPSAPSESSSRMVEAITWCTACGLTDFENCYQQNLADNNRAIIEHDVLAGGIRALMRRRAQWKGTMTGLAATLKASGHQVSDHLQTLSEHLREIAPALRSGFGIAVKFVRTKKERLIEISSSPSSSSSSSSSPDEDR
jgi:hypothetical protein